MNDKENRNSKYGLEDLTLEEERFICRVIGSITDARKTRCDMTVRAFEKFLTDAVGFSNQEAKVIASRGFAAVQDYDATKDPEIVDQIHDLTVMIGGSNGSNKSCTDARFQTGIRPTETCPGARFGLDSKSDDSTAGPLFREEGRQAYLKEHGWH